MQNVINIHFPCLLRYNTKLNGCVEFRREFLRIRLTILKNILKVILKSYDFSDILFALKTREANIT